MVLLPIIERELRVAARRGKNYWLRVAAALLAAVVSAWIVLGSGKALPTATLGSTLFAYLSVLAFAFCLLVGPFITADCISEEKRDGTLGLLFLTELSSLQVVLGKWIATALAGFYGLLAILPSLGIPLLLGGVTPGEYGRTALAVTNAILFSLTAGMFVSAISREQTKATMGSVALILGLTGLVPGLFVFFLSGVLGQPVNQVPPLALISPAYTGRLALDAAYKAAPQQYWISLACVHGLSWCFLLLTAALLPRVWRSDPQEKPAKRRWLLRFGYTAGWRRVFHRRLERNPVFAVAARLRWPYLVFWTLVVLVAINVYWIAIGSRRNPAAAQFHQNFAYALIFTNRVWITVMACHFLLEARRSGALELLLTSPLPVRTLLRGHRRALRAYFFWPIVTIGLLHGLFVWGNLTQGGSTAVAGFSMRSYYIAAAASSFVNYLTDVLALCAVGGWLSVALRKPAVALLLTFVLVILAPWGVGRFLPGIEGLVPSPVRAWLQSLPGVQALASGAMLGFPMTRTVIWILKNLALILWARGRLRHRFREAAAQALASPVRMHWPGRTRPTRQGTGTPELSAARGAVGRS